MKTQLRIPVLTLLAVLSLMMTAVSASAQGLLFSNGGPAGNIYGWEIDSGYVVSDSFQFASGSTATSFVVGLWVLPGETPQHVDWSITTAENGGTFFDSGSYNFASTDLTPSPVKGTTFIGGNGLSGTPCPNTGCDIYRATVNIPGGVSLSGGSTYWLNLQNAFTNVPGDPVGWDENNGPNSMASQNAMGTIGSEDPDFYGTPNGTPEPSSLTLFGSGILGLGGLLRRRFLG